MFYDKQSMLDMFNVSVPKKHWQHLLLTSELFHADYSVVTRTEAILMHNEWKEAIKRLVDKNDAAYLINQGNIYCLVHEKNLPNFKKAVEELVFAAPSGRGKLRVAISQLTSDETEYFLKQS